MRSEAFILATYFLILICSGTILLCIPGSWEGEQQLPLIDCAFTATSAACVTGLISVDTASYSRFGQIVIIILIQLGGLGIISFSTLYVVLPSNRLSLKGRKIIREYYLDTIEYEPLQIVRQIVISTLIIEAFGAFFIYISFSNKVGENALFFSIFHSISAFCNAGFSLFSNNLEYFVKDPIINTTVMTLIIAGGIGFVVLRDIVKRVVKKKKRLTLHTKIVIMMTISLIIIGAMIIFIFEYGNATRDLIIQDKIMAACFQSVTARTAGFNTIRISDMSISSHLSYLLLMFIGAAPGSTAGGIKVTTFFLLLVIILKNLDKQKGIRIFKRRLSSHTFFKASLFIVKVFSFLMVSIFILSVTEFIAKPGADFYLFPLVFECFSAFGTVGLSLGITSTLSVFGKIIIIVTMLYGRVGVIIIAMKVFDTKKGEEIDYPEEEVLIG